jgi:hypothetical protein
MDCTVPVSFFVLGGTEVSTQGLVLGMQALKHLSHTPTIFAFLGYFSDRVLCFYPSQSRTKILLFMCYL